MRLHFVALFFQKAAFALINTTYLDDRMIKDYMEGTMDSASNETTLPKGLEGLVVVELGDYVAMPACPRLLGELGATVYKIETLTGNLHRLDGPGFGMPELGMDNPAFDMSNANKKFLSLDVRSEGGREIALKLLEKAHIFVTSLRTPSLKRLGFDYETLHKRFPKLVYGQMRGYGERGPRKMLKGLMLLVTLHGGLLMSIPQAGEHFMPGNMPAAGDWNASIALGMGLMEAPSGVQKKLA